MGAETYGITNCLNFGNPEKPYVYYQLAKAMEGMGEACRVLEAPITGGNASLYNETDGEAILPTIVIGAVGVIEDYKKTVFSGFKKAGDTIGLLGVNKEEVGGSLFFEKVAGKTGGLIAGKCPDIDIKFEARLQKLIRTIINEGNNGNLISSAQDVSDGGLAVALCECSINSGLGLNVNIDEDISADALLFGETQSRIVISFNEENEMEIEKLSKSYDIPFKKIGSVEKSKFIKISINGKNIIELDLKETVKLYNTRYL